MKCNICDKTLSEAEIIMLPDGKFDCCSICLEIAMDAAYSDGFTREDPLTYDPEFDEEFGTGEVEILDEPDTYRSCYDHSDPYTLPEENEDDS